MENRNSETLTQVKNESGFVTYKTHFLPVLGLLLFAPFTAEYIIGYLDVTGDFGLMFLYLIFFGPLYGGAALIIREFTRRAGLGLLTMTILAFAFGLFQAGMIDHGLFNPAFQNIDYWQELRDPTYISFLGISAYQAVDFISGHVIWSIMIPIVIMEIFFPNRKKYPWLSNVNLTIIIILYLLASLFIFQDQMTMDQFLPSVTQFFVTGIIVIALIITSFTVGKHNLTRIEKTAPHPFFVGTVTLFLLSMHTIIELLAVLLGASSDFMMEWPGVILRMMSLSLLGYLILVWSKQKGWNSMHHLALAGGAILTRTWIAFLIQPLGNVPSSDKLIGNTTFLLGAIVLILYGIYVIHKKGHD
ncbi:hypothetical protein [Halalkalibacter sp. APA_J-10(15)]|uniref:hypothetical protein n=1 Tax=Halalkalibacter sp. APA_J-10(15) TaxID=2933805 RepID=UPI001FF2D801|nr:hypothetical protein [Halalkalibacter sp. APA_J-10(15)]MCK0472745.1 hypothetical protein [Halalkalibacter sp. APA_J-10(15)]